MADLRLVDAASPLDLRTLFERGRWRHTLLLTYSFDMPFFDSYILPFLVKQGGHSIAVAADAVWLGERLPRWIEEGEIREAGTSYSLSGVRVPGTFHPKLLLAASESNGLVLIGSGNLSAYGMASGGELFTAIEWHSGDVPSLACEAWQLCNEMAQTLPVDRAFKHGVRRLVELVPVLAVQQRDRTLVHNLTEPLIEQLARRVGATPVARLTIWSPFTDRRLTAFRAIIERFRPAHVTIALQPGLTSIDGNLLAQLAGEYANIEWYFPELRAEFGGGLIHAKGILAVLDNGDEVLLAGSPNLSAPALLRTATQANFESAMLVAGRDVGRALFGQGSKVTLGVPIDVESLRWRDDASVHAPVHAAAAFHLLGASWDGETLSFEVRGDPPTAAQGLVNETRIIPLVRGKESWQAIVPADPPPTLAAITWDGGKSGPVVVADLPKLAAAASDKQGANHAALDTLDYGDDRDLIEWLEKLAQITIISPQDYARIVSGRTQMSDTDEAKEAVGDAPPVGLDAVDFATIRQHPRGAAYGTHMSDGFGTPELQRWLDEIVQQFDAIRARQQLRLLNAAGDDESDDLDDDTQKPAHEPRRWRISERIRVRVRNRMRRYIQGVRDPRFWQLADRTDKSLMAKNYSLFLGFLDRLWRRGEDPETSILPANEVAQLCLDLLEGFWGSDEREGYWTNLAEDDAIADACTLIDYRGDALTVAVAERLLTLGDASSRFAPFVIAGFVRAAEQVGLLTEEAAGRALSFLDREDEDPGTLLEKLHATTLRFSWDRFLYLVTKKYRLRSARLVPKVFVNGDTLMIDADAAVDKHPFALAPLANWIITDQSRGATRQVYQMVWGREEDVVIYLRSDRTLIWRRKGADGRYIAHTLSADVSPLEFGSWKWIASQDNDRRAV